MAVKSIGLGPPRCYFSIFSKAKTPCGQCRYFHWTALCFVVSSNDALYCHFLPAAGLDPAGTRKQTTKAQIQLGWILFRQNFGETPPKYAKTLFHLNFWGGGAQPS
eukprot:EG_transcript_48862